MSKISFFIQGLPFEHILVKLYETNKLAFADYWMLVQYCYLKQTSSFTESDIKNFYFAESFEFDALVKFKILSKSDNTYSIYDSLKEQMGKIIKETSIVKKISKENYTKLMNLISEWNDKIHTKQDKSQFEIIRKTSIKRIKDSGTSVDDIERVLRLLTSKKLIPPKTNMANCIEKGLFSLKDTEIERLCKSSDDFFIEEIDQIAEQEMNRAIDNV